MSKEIPVEAPPPYAPPSYGFAVPDQGHPQQQQYGSMPPPPPGYYQQQQPPATVFVPGNVPTTTTRTVIINAAGNCPVCGVGVLREELTCFGITMAILFFPIGLLCLLVTQKRCSNCGSTF